MGVKPRAWQVRDSTIATALAIPPTKGIRSQTPRCQEQYPHAFTYVPCPYITPSPSS